MSTDPNEVTENDEPPIWVPPAPEPEEEEPETPEEPPVYEVPEDQVETAFTIYDPATGWIKRTGYCIAGDLELQVQPGEALVLGYSDDDFNYVLDEVILDRPAFTISKTEIVADDTDEAVITGLPDPVEVKIDGTAYEITGGTLALSSPMPATYKVEIDHWPYLPFSVEVTAV